MEYLYYKRKVAELRRHLPSSERISDDGKFSTYFHFYKYLYINCIRQNHSTVTLNYRVRNKTKEHLLWIRTWRSEYVFALMYL